MIQNPRPLTEDEKKVLSNQTLHPISLGSWLLLIVLVLIVSAGLVAIFLHEFPALRPAQVPLTMATATVMVAAFVSYRNKSLLHPSHYDQLRLKDLEEGVAHVWTFSAVESIQVEEFEDEGSSFFLHLKDGQVLFLSGQYLYDYDDGKKFPCTEFDVVQAPHSRIIFEVICRGDYLPPTQTLKSFTTEQFEKNEVPEDLEILKTPWNEIAAKYS